MALKNGALRSFIRLVQILLKLRLDLLQIMYTYQNVFNATAIDHEFVNEFNLIVNLSDILV